MYKIVKWLPELDLTEFYTEAGRRGFENNASQQAIIDCFSKERESQAWILYCNEKAVGSVVAHSLDILPNAYRICARTCVLTDLLSGPYSNGLRTKNVITKHQNPTAQFFIPACIEWAGKDNNLYITTNTSKVGSQQKVNSTFASLLERTKVLRLAHVIEYRGHLQNFWQLDADVFLEQLSQNNRWS